MEGVKNTVWIRILRLLYIAIKVYIKVSKYLDETTSVSFRFVYKTYRLNILCCVTRIHKNPKIITHYKALS